MHRRGNGENCWRKKGKSWAIALTREPGLEGPGPQLEKDEEQESKRLIPQSKYFTTLDTKDKDTRCPDLAPTPFSSKRAMRRLARLFRLPFMILAGVAAACGQDRSPTHPSAPSQVHSDGLTTTIPASMRPSETVQLRAVLTSGGLTRDVTESVEWYSSDERVASVAPGGLLTGHVVGEASIGSRLDGWDYGMRHVLVLHPGTIVLGVDVRDAAGPVFGATVTIVSGPAAGTSRTTDWSGRAHVFFGIPGDSEILVTKDGFDPLQQNPRISTDFGPRGHWLTFTLNRKHARRDYSGVYVLDLVATCSGPNALPTPLQRRSYTATLSQRGHEVTMTLSGADFVLSERWANGNVVEGFVDDTAAMFGFGDAYDWDVHPDVMEQLPDGTVLVITGIVEAAPTERGLTGTLNGSFTVYADSSSFLVRSSCRSGLHSFTLTR
jgi:hypothetical protein